MLGDGVKVKLKSVPLLSLSGGPGPFKIVMVSMISFCLFKSA